MNKAIIQSPNDKRGYTNKELRDLCKKLNINEDDFNNALGTNTCGYDPKTDTVFTYKCDVENALNKINKGKYLFFD